MMLKNVIRKIVVPDSSIMKRAAQSSAVIASIGLLMFGQVPDAYASPVDVSYTVAGSAGSWILNFSVTNNLGGTNALYLFGVRLGVPSVVATPVGWDSTALPGGTNWFNYGGSNTNYNVNWITCVDASCPAGHPLVDVDPGQTLAGFEVKDSESIAPASVSWFTVAAGGTYNGPGCSFICNAPHDNPGFEGLALPTVSAVPEPSTWALMMLGFFAIGLMTRRHNSKFAFTSA